MHQAELPEVQIKPTQTTDYRTDELVPDSEHVPDSELVPESPTEWTNIGDDSSVSF